MAQDKDYYSILQVNRNASQEEIERAYERLSRTYDPARSRKARAAQRHAEVVEAYEVLSDRQKRREYDRGRRRTAAAGSVLPADVLSNRLVIFGAGTLVASVIAILGIILLFGGDGDKALVANPTTPAATVTPAVSIPAQTPGVPPESPPEITGEEVVLDSGLRYIDFEPGTGEEAKNGDDVAVNYSGWLESDGTLFDSSLENPLAFRFTIGARSVIPGWEQGVPGMKEGGKRRLIIPPELAYGEAGQGSTIPPNATLIFDVELVDILVAVPEAIPTLPAQTPTDPAQTPPDVSGEEVTLESGLTYIDFEPGTGDVAETGDTVAVNYTGWLQSTGELFDSSLSRTFPFQVTLGGGAVIQGWEEGLPGMAEGGSRRLIIPPELGYGEAAQGSIPGNSTLIFDIVLVDILQEAE